MKIMKLAVCFFLIITVTMGLSGLSVAQEITQETQLTLGPKACADCHTSSIGAWKPTQHYKTFKALTRNKKAKEIAKNMGIRRMKSQSDCMTCHFTSIPKKGKAKVVAGISCESCHGPGKNWIEIHSNFGDNGVKASEETAEHKAQRFAQSEQNGMIRPGNLYKVGKNCYSCHTVPNEKLVNTGGHAAGSEFELVQWSQGEVRHNVWYDENVNRPAPQERLRMMFIIGKALDLEYSLRGLAKATEEQTYYTAMVKRQQNALEGLKQIASKLNNSAVSAIINSVNSADIKINNSAALSSSANKVGQATQALADKFDGSQFAAIDSLLPAASSYKGNVFQP